MLRMCSVRYFVDIYELQTEFDVPEARGVANFGTQCIWHRPFDVLGGLGDEEALNVRLQLKLGSRVDRQTTVIRVGLARFNGDQQQLETHETQSKNTQTHSKYTQQQIHMGPVRSKLFPWSGHQK